MEITVLLSEALAAAVANGNPTSLEAVLLRHRATLRAMHPASSDPQLRRYYVALLPEPTAAEQLRVDLATQPGVEAAYIKPAAALP